MALPLYGEFNVMGSTLVGEDKDKLQRLMEASSSIKSSYASWIHYFNKGEGSLVGFPGVSASLLAILVIFPGGPEDG